MKDGVNHAWPEVTLGDVCQFVNGDRGKNYPGRKALVPSGVPFINAGHIDDGTIDWEGMDFIPQARFDLLGSGKILHGDILYCLRGSLGKFGVVEREEQGAIASSLVIVRPSEVVDVDYLAYYFRSSIAADMIEQFAGGAAQPNLSAKNLSQYRLPLPPLEEQRKIVAILDEAFEGLARAKENAEVNLQNARELFSLSFEHELIASADQSKLTTIGEACSGFEYGTSAKSKTSGIVPVLRMGNLQSGEIDWGNLVYTDNVADIDKLNLKKGDVLFNRTNSLEHVGKAAIYRGERQAIFAGYLIRLQFDREKLLPEFLNMFLNSRGARNYGRSISGKSVNQANISASKLKTYPMRLPPFDVQNEIVRKAEKMREPIDDLAAQYVTQVRDFDDLRQSLLQKAFAGDLT